MPATHTHSLSSLSFFHSLIPAACLASLRTLNHQSSVLSESRRLTRPFYKDFRRLWYVVSTIINTVIESASRVCVSLHATVLNFSCKTYSNALLAVVVQWWLAPTPGFLYRLSTARRVRTVKIRYSSSYYSPDTLCRARERTKRYSTQLRSLSLRSCHMSHDVSSQSGGCSLQ